ncbi:MAG: hypothetical protein M1830_006850, partial [Pleopsidium flavum]
MPSKIREKDRDRDRDTPKKDRHRSSRTTRKPSSKDRDKDPTMPGRSSTTNSSASKRRSSMPVPELERRASSTSPYGSKMALPYPSFSKAHSKEAVGSREDVVPRRLSLYTPDPTDLACTKEVDSAEPNIDQVAGAGGQAPPSPPLTTMAPEIKRENSKGSMRKVTMEVEEEVEGINVEDGGSRTQMRPKPTKSKGSLRRLMKEEGSLATSSSRKSKSSSTGAKSKSRPFATVEDSSSYTNGTHSLSPTPSSTTGTATVTDSDATSIAPTYLKHQQQQTPD